MRKRGKHIFALRGRMIDHRALCEHNQQGAVWRSNPKRPIGNFEVGLQLAETTYPRSVE